VLERPRVILPLFPSKVKRRIKRIKKTEEIKRRASARSEASRASQQKLAAQKSKREMLVEQIQKSSINDIRLSSNEPNLNALEQNISAVIEQIIEKKLKKNWARQSPVPVYEIEYTKGYLESKEDG